MQVEIPPSIAHTNARYNSIVVCIEMYDYFLVCELYVCVMRVRSCEASQGFVICHFTNEREKSQKQIQMRD